MNIQITLKNGWTSGWLLISDFILRKGGKGKGEKALILSSRTIL